MKLVIDLFNPLIEESTSQALQPISIYPNERYGDYLLQFCELFVLCCSIVKLDIKYQFHFPVNMSWS